MSSALPLSAVLLSLLTAPPTKAPAVAAKDTGPSTQVAGRLIGAALTEGHAYARLSELTDTIGQRLSGTEGVEAAVRWAKRSFEADGVKVWLEPVKVPR